MTEGQTPLEPTRIEVVASDRCRPLLQSGRVLERSGRFLDGLLGDLELPLRFELKLDEAGRLPRGADLRISSHGECVTLWSLPSADADIFSQAFSECLLRCRARFIDAAVARRIWTRWFPDKEAHFDEAGFAEPFRDLCARLVTRGLKPGRAKVDFETLDPIKGNIFPRVFEQVLARADHISVGLYLSPEQYARGFAEGGKATASSGDAQSSFQELLDLMADGLFYETGLTYRMEDVQIDRELKAPWFRIRWNDVFAPPIKGLTAQEFLVNDTVDRLTLLNVKAREALNPATHTQCAVIQRDAKKTCEEAGLTTWSAEDYVVLHASSEIRRNAGSFMTTNLTTLYQATLSESFPDLVLEAGRRFDREVLTDILRLLLDEEISIRDMRSILNALLAMNAGTTADLGRFIVFVPNTGIQCPVRPGQTLADLTPSAYCDCVRTAMRRYIGYKYARGGNTMVVYLVAPAIEDLFRKGPLPPGQREKLLDAIGEEIGQLSPLAQTPVILTAYDVRRPLRELIACDFPRTAVLSYQELSPDMNIQPIARIELPTEAATGPAPSPSSSPG